MFRSKQILPTHNRLLAALPHQESQRFLSYLEQVSLPRDEVLFDVGEAVNHAYFITSGMISLLAVSISGETVEVAVVGREGLVGTATLLKISKTPWRAKVQLDATALRIKAARLRAETERNGLLRDLTLSYAHTMVTQFSQSVVCSLFHAVEQRLARWLLITCDRAEYDSFDLTHENISEMLGASRSAVSKAAGVLRQAGLIRHLRGRMTILDREGLEKACCECYQVIRDDMEYYLP